MQLPTLQCRPHGGGPAVCGMNTHPGAVATVVLAAPADGGRVGNGSGEILQRAEDHR